MSSQKWMQFWESLHGEHPVYTTEAFLIDVQIPDIERGMSCMRVYRNTDGTWSLMPNWFNNAEQNHKRSAATTYETVDAIPDAIQNKLGVLLLSESGGDWLTGVGKRVDDGVFWLEDG